MARAAMPASAPIGPPPVMKTRDPAVVPAFWLAQMPTDSGSSSPTAASESESGTGWAKSAGTVTKSQNAPSYGGVAKNAMSRAEVEVAGLALPAAAARPLRLERDALTDAVAGHVRADADDGAADLVPEDQRALDDHVGDPAVLVVVHVRAAHPHRPDPHEHLVGTRGGHRSLLHLDGRRCGEHRRAHGVGHGWSPPRPGPAGAGSRAAILPRTAAADEPDPTARMPDLVPMCASCARLYAW